LRVRSPFLAAVLSSVARDPVDRLEHLVPAAVGVAEHLGLDHAEEVAVDLDAAVAALFAGDAEGLALALAALLGVAHRGGVGRGPGPGGPARAR
jgi:hypothetical protein